MGRIPAGLKRPLHLARRFFGSLWPGGPGAADREWVAEILSTSELVIWKRMSGADQRHAAGVARRVSQAGVGERREVLAAALLHDSGKVVSAVGTFGRVAATLLGPARARGRLAEYLRHDVLGADLLGQAGSHPLTVAWAREHHLAPERWSVPMEVGAVLKAADDD